MANRYWVGGTASWDGTASSKWALTSGGAGGEAVPTSSDNVFFDGNSGTGIATIASGNTGCLDIDFSGFTGTIAGSTTIQISGSITYGSGMTFTNTSFFTLLGTGSHTIRTNGITIKSLEIFGTGTFNQLDNITCTGSKGITFFKGTYNTNSYNISADVFSSNSNFNRTVNFGNSLITITGGAGGGVFTWGGAGTLTLNPGNSTILINPALASMIMAFGNNTFNDIIFSATSGTYTFSGYPTFNLFSITRGGQTFSVTAGTTITANTVSLTGSSGNLVVMNSTSAGSFWSISKPSGSVIADYISLRDSHAVGGATWFAGANSLNLGGNSGWIFSGFTSVLTNIVDSNNISVLLATSNVNGSTTVKVQVGTNNRILVNNGVTGSDLSGDNVSRDDNGNPVIMAVSSADGVTPVAVYADPSTGRLLVQST